jgi:hypothetical protein
MACNSLQVSDWKQLLRKLNFKIMMLWMLVNIVYDKLQVSIVNI